MTFSIFSSSPKPDVFTVLFLLSHYTNKALLCQCMCTQNHVCCTVHTGFKQFCFWVMSSGTECQVSQLAHKRDLWQSFFHSCGLWTLLNEGYYLVIARPFLTFEIVHETGHSVDLKSQVMACHRSKVSSDCRSVAVNKTPQESWSRMKLSKLHTEYFIHPIMGNDSVNSHIKATIIKTKNKLSPCVHTTYQYCCILLCFLKSRHKNKIPFHRFLFVGREENAVQWNEGPQIKLDREWCWSCDRQWPSSLNDPWSRLCPIWHLILWPDITSLMNILMNAPLAVW